MKTHELLEGADDDLYVNAVVRMFGNFGMPGIAKCYDVKLRGKMLLLKLKNKGLRDHSFVDPIETFKIPVDGMTDAVRHAVADATGDVHTVMTYVLENGQWSPGEATIATSPLASCTYAARVIKGPWPPGEAAILRDPPEIVTYAADVLHHRWLEGEKALIQLGDAVRCFEYANDVIKGRWPEAEGVINSHWLSKRDYKTQVLDKL